MYTTLLKTKMSWKKHSCLGRRLLVGVNVSVNTCVSPCVSHAIDRWSVILPLFPLKVCWNQLHLDTHVHLSINAARRRAPDTWLILLVKTSRWRAWSYALISANNQTADYVRVISCHRSGDKKAGWLPMWCTHSHTHVCKWSGRGPIMFQNLSPIPPHLCNVLKNVY